jgi:ribosomal protein S18 acetylase RimI-like enzyme
MRKWITLVESSDYRQGLRDLVANAAAKGVKLEVETGEDSILLIEIERLGPARGAGAEVMRELCAFADENNLMIFLHVAQGMRRLVSYYESFGFEMEEDYEMGPEEREEHPDADEHSYGYEVAMYRAPRV